LHEGLLELNLLIKHILGLIFFFTEAGHHISGELLLELEGILDLLDLLLLSLELLGFLLLLGHATAFNASKNVCILFVKLLLIEKSLLDLSESHLFEVQQILDAGVSNRDIDVYL